MEKFVEKYAVQPICFDQDIKSIYKRFYDIERYVSRNLYRSDPFAFIVSKCFVVDHCGPSCTVVFSYNPKYGIIYDAPVFDENRNMFLNSYVTSTVYDTYEEALDECDKKNSMLINIKALASKEDYETAYKKEKMKVELVRYALDSLLSGTNGLDDGYPRSK